VLNLLPFRPQCVRRSSGGKQDGLSTGLLTCTFLAVPRQLANNPYMRFLLVDIDGRSTGVLRPPARSFRAPLPAPGDTQAVRGPAPRSTRRHSRQDGGQQRVSYSSQSCQGRHVVPVAGLLNVTAVPRGSTPGRERCPCICSVELPGIEPELRPGLLVSELQVHSVSLHFNPARHLWFRCRVLTASRAVCCTLHDPLRSLWR
jgi:hypothetical protein